MLERGGRFVFKRSFSIGNKLHFRTKLFNDAEAPTRKNLYLIIREQLEPADSWIRALPLELTTPRKSPILIEQEEEEPPNWPGCTVTFYGGFYERRATRVDLVPARKNSFSIRLQISREPLNLSTLNGNILSRASKGFWKCHERTSMFFLSQHSLVRKHRRGTLWPTTTRAR